MTQSLRPNNNYCSQITLSSNISLNRTINHLTAINTDLSELDNSSYSNQYEHKPSMNSLEKMFDQTHINPAYLKIHKTKNKAFIINSKQKKKSASNHTLTPSSQIQQPASRQKHEQLEQLMKRQYWNSQKLCQKCKKTIGKHRKNNSSISHQINVDIYDKSLNLQKKSSLTEFKAMHNSENLRIVKESGQAIREISNQLRQYVQYMEMQFKKYKEEFQELAKSVVEECSRVIVAKEQRIFRLELDLINSQESAEKLKGKVKKMKKEMETMKKSKLSKFGVSPRTQKNYEKLLPEICEESIEQYHHEGQT